MLPAMLSLRVTEMFTTDGPAASTSALKSGRPRGAGWVTAGAGAAWASASFGRESLEQPAANAAMTAAAMALRTTRVLLLVMCISPSG